MSDSHSSRSSSSSLTSSSDLSPCYNNPRFLHVEDREWYCENGYHPVNLQDEFKDSRYRVIHKLGHGTFATVWLARDQIEGRYVALKISAVSEAPTNNEINILQLLAADNSQHPGKQHVVSLLDHFTHEGPNGTHACFVFPVLGPTFAHKSYAHSGRFPVEFARKICYQMGEAIAYLHSSNVVHGDISNCNVLFKIKQFDEWTEEEIYERLGKPKKEPLTLWDGGSPGPEAPKEVVQAIDMGALDSQYLLDDIVINDLGAGYMVGTPWSRMTPPESYCSPEIGFGEPCGQQSDIWSFGCVMFDVCYHCPLFTSGEWTTNQDNLFARMVEVFGPFPARWWSCWEARDRWFEEDGTIKNSEWDDQPAWPLGWPFDFALTIREAQKRQMEGKPINYDNLIATPCEEPYPPTSDKYTPAPPCTRKSKAQEPTNRCPNASPERLASIRRKFYPDESADLTDLLGHMLRYCPEERFTADQILQHKFFDGVLTQVEEEGGFQQFVGNRPLYSDPIPGFTASGWREWDEKQAAKAEAAKVEAANVEAANVEANILNLSISA
ncbi:MAG: hypothetical protein Q9228_006463 [Teloschistes exilis]